MVQKYLRALRYALSRELGSAFNLTWSSRPAHCPRSWERVLRRSAGCPESRSLERISATHRCVGGEGGTVPLKIELRIRMDFAVSRPTGREAIPYCGPPPGRDVPVSLCSSISGAGGSCKGHCSGTSSSLRGLVCGSPSRFLFRAPVVLCLCPAGLRPEPSPAESVPP